MIAVLLVVMVMVMMVVALLALGQGRSIIIFEQLAYSRRFNAFTRSVIVFTVFVSSFDRMSWPGPPFGFDDCAFLFRGYVCHLVRC